ncbi:MAG: chloride channel protein [Prevotella sp.]|jgi:CIC family chloride channel protein|nr:chloride channel protein [Prevotella sp.]
MIKEYIEKVRQALNSEWFDDVLTWRKNHLSDRQFTLVLAFFVGIFAALAAYLLHGLIHVIQHLLTQEMELTSFNWLFLVLPVVGIWLTMLFVRYVVRDNISHGITRILYAISSKKSRLAAHNCWSSVVASAITIGFGGSVGAEAPIVLTGSAIASNLGQKFRMNNKTLMLLVGCGAAAAIAGIFKAPIAGLVFTIEVLMIDLTMASISPILIASVTATCFTYVMVGDSQLFTFHTIHPWVVERVPANIGLGLFCGLISLYFIRMMSACEGIFARMNNRYARLATGGLILSTLIFFFPSLYGEGYSSINILLDGSSSADLNKLMEKSMFYGKGEMILLFYVCCVILTKCFATASTNGGGGCGGTFAPSLFIGAFTGFLFARIWNMYGVGVFFPEENAALLGMAGVMSGVMHAPLTGVFLIAELTAGYDLFMPLMIVSVCAYLTILAFEPHSIYGMRLARQGKLITHHTDKSVLTLMTLDSVIDKEFTPVGKDMELQQLVYALSDSHSDVLPVLDPAGNLLGEVNLAKIRHIVFRTELYHRFRVSQLMEEVKATVRLGDPMEDVMAAFEKYNVQHLPVIDGDGHLFGYISKAHLYSQYRQMVADLSND